MGIKNFIKKWKEENTLKGTVCHYTSYFTTVDGKEHKDTKYKYIAEDLITVPGPQYMMQQVKYMGYLTDDEDKMYLLHNVVSIEWVKDDEVENVPLHMEKVFYDKDSIKKGENEL